MRQGSYSKRSRGGRANGRRPNFYGRNQTFESSGPDVKVRGTAPQVVEKYQALARDALASGDRVAAENFLQHAEHYYRVMVAANPQQRRGTEASAQEAGETRGETPPAPTSA